MEFLLIEAVQMHPCLFDKTLVAYRNKITKEKAWRAVAADTNASVEQCQSRWRSLRDRYVKEVNRSKPPSGSGANDGSGWRFMDAMSFLQRHVAPRSTSSNMQWSQTFSSTQLACGDISASTQLACGDISASTQLADEDVEPDFFCSELSPTLGQSTPRVEKRAKRKRQGDRFEYLCDSVSDWIRNQPAQSQSPQPVSRNAEFLQVLDGYLLKHSEEDQDRLKIQLLNIVSNFKQ